jgi:hypothetical protein
MTADRIPISREALNAKVLTEIRKHPGCETVCEIAITIEAILNQGTTWHITVVDAGDADVAVAIRAARAIQAEWETCFAILD